MRFLVLLYFVSCVSILFANAALSSEEEAEVTDTCCTYGERFATSISLVQQCNDAEPPDELEPDQIVTCLAGLRSCCEKHLSLKDDCTSGMALAPARRCTVPKSDIGKTCCEECSIGRWTGESQGKESCGGPADDYDSPTSALRKNAYYKCCVEAAERPTTPEPPPPTTPKRPETTTKARERCKVNSCDHVCNDDDGKIRCRCRDGFRLQSDKRTCKDINECAEAMEDVCTAEGTVCHNTPGSFKCVPIKKRDTLTCPPGFKRNVQNQVCDDINECQSPRPPCPKYLCENTIGGFKCAGKPGQPYQEAAPGATDPPGTTVKNDICPPGFRSGPNDECLDIDECEERLDDCQRLSQHCINTHGSFFCQDHVSKRCAPGFKVNRATGICEDIDECEESSEVCQRSEVCVNMPGAYSCKSKISTLPRLGTTRTCQEGRRMRPGSTVCEDIDECREGTHLCDQFQNCVNTYGAHECQCKNGFELDSSGSCVDIDECSLKLDNCREGTHCLNVVGTFTCTRRPPTSSTRTVASPAYDYEYYDEEDNSTINNETNNALTTPKITPPLTPPSYPTPRTTQPTRTRPTTPTTPRLTPPTPRQTPPTPRPTTPTPRPITTTPRPTRPPYTPRTTTTRRPYTSRPRQPERHDLPVEVTVPTPVDPVTVERERNPNGSYDINTGEIPKERWTNVIGKESDTGREPGFDPNELHCLNGYERNSRGDCVDVNECESNRHICSSLEECENRAGGYTCNCIPGYRRNATGWCITEPSSPTPRPTVITTPVTPSTQATERVTQRPRDRDTTRPTMNCELGFTFDVNAGKCIDIDECATNKANCGPKEDCVNVEGGYRCICGRRCMPETEHRPSFLLPPHHPTPESNVITVGAQYGQRGPRYLRPTYARLPNTGAIVTSCPWGYKLTPEKMCLDIDECAKNVSECGPEQRCENFPGGYSCQCGAGLRLRGASACQDIDECRYGQPCPYNSACINTVGSYRCACGAGFRNAPTNDKVCVDVDECAASPAPCHQGCANAWGGYRCYCDRGYRLHSDNRTCADVDECSEWGSVRLRGRLCGGSCLNEPGSYRCECPRGYRLADDGRSCIDIDECETGAAECATGGRGGGGGGGAAGEVCQNTRGGYHCHRIDCPAGYRLEARHRCSRIQRSCPISDWECLHQPSAYSYNFITFVANIYLPEGSVDLFTMHGPAWVDSIVSFEMRMVRVQASTGVKPLDLNCFDMRPTNNICVISLLCSPGGPQVAELELTMSLYQRGQFAGSAVARLVVIVSQYKTSRLGLITILFFTAITELVLSK